MNPAELERLADLIADRLLDRLEIPDRLLTAEEVAERFGISRSYIYENQDRLGAIPLGDGPRARLRFDPARVVEALSPQPFEAPAEPKHAKPRARQPVDLLPIGRKS